MALQSSGPISLSDIATEQGISTSNMSLRSMSNTAGFATPDAITEFYGWSSYSNDYYWNFSSAGNLEFNRVGTVQLSNNDLSVSLWIRPEWAATDVNELLFEMTPSNAATSNDRFFILFDYGLNRIVLRQRSNGVNSRGTHYSLNDSGNYAVSGTGGGKWTASNRGNTNADGFVHLVVTFDYSATSGETAFDVYWNGSQLPNTVTNLTGTLTTYSYDDVFINSTYTGTNTREAKYDEVAVFNNKLLSSTEISNLYNSGTPISPAQAGEDDNVMFYFDAESSTASAVSGDDYTTTWSLATSNGSRTAY